jgi:hypothetical protein
MAQFTIDMDNMYVVSVNQQLLKTVVEDKILHELRPLIWDNLIVEPDSRTLKCRYSLDVWLRQ